MYGILIGVGILTLHAVYSLVRCMFHSLTFGCKAFMYLLAGADSGKDYGDIRVRLIAMHSDHVLSKVKDLDGRTHIEQVHFPRFADGS
jgi:hypothetical protein